MEVGTVPLSRRSPGAARPGTVRGRTFTGEVFTIKILSHMNLSLLLYMIVVCVYSEEQNMIQIKLYI